MPGKRRRGRASQPSRPPQPGTVQGPVIGARTKSRRELRAERRRQKRRRLGVFGVAGLVVVGLIVAAAVGFGVKQATSSGHKNTNGQTTLLLSVAGNDGTAAETALLAHDDRTHHGVELLIPRRVLTQVCGFGNQQLGQILALPNGPALSRTAVSNLLGGVTVDGSWVLTTTQLAKLVDRLGGITVDIDTDVIQQHSDGSRVLVIPKGDAQHLNGSQAATYVTYLRPDEDALANLVRLQNVLDGIEAVLPRDASAVAKDVQALGAGGSSTLGADRLADVLVGFASDSRHDNVLPTALPVTKIDAGGTVSSYRVDSQQISTFVKANLAASLPRSARVVRKSVFVQNGIGTPGLASSACDKLVKAGYAFAGSGNANNFTQQPSVVLVSDNTVASARLGDSIAHALGLSVDDVKVQESAQNVADVIVILGKDYKP